MFLLCCAFANRGSVKPVLMSFPGMNLLVVAELNGLVSIIRYKDWPKALGTKKKTLTRFARKANSFAQNLNRLYDVE